MSAHPQIRSSDEPSHTLISSTISQPSISYCQRIKYMSVHQSSRPSNYSSCSYYRIGTQASRHHGCCLQSQLLQYPTHIGCKSMDRFFKGSSSNSHPAQKLQQQSMERHFSHCNFTKSLQDVSSQEQSFRRRSISSNEITPRRVLPPVHLNPVSERTKS